MGLPKFNNLHYSSDFQEILARLPRDINILALWGSEVASGAGGAINARTQEKLALVASLALGALQIRTDQLL